MERAGEQVVVDSVAALNLDDGASTVDAEDSVLGVPGAPRRRRHDDDDDGSDELDEDDTESLASGAANGKRKKTANVDEEKELPSYACA